MVCALVFGLVSACGGSSSSKAEDSPTPVPPYEVPEPTYVEDVPTVDPEPVSTLPPGYPKVVLVKSLPSQIRSWYEMDHYTRAVAIAPGVWTPLPPGATVDDAVASETLDGFCASIKAYERQYLDGEELAGTCW